MSRTKLDTLSPPPWLLQKWAYVMYTMQEDATSFHPMHATENPPHGVTATEFLPSFYCPPYHNSIAVPRDLGEKPPPSFQRMLK